MQTILLLLYVVFAIVHPLSELRSETSLRGFLNRVYYRSGRDDFPVSRLLGVGGSLFVIAVFLAPLWYEVVRGPAALSPDALEWHGWVWCFALGLAVADLVQHATHFAAHRRERAPRVHLLTIAIVLPLLFVIDHPSDVFGRECLKPVAFGAVFIFGNWLQNSVRVRIKQRSGTGR